jgi:hypothetical protein
MKFCIDVMLLAGPQILTFKFPTKRYINTKDARTCEVRSSVSAIYRSKAVPVTGRGGPQDYETSRLPHFLDCRLTDVVSLMSRPPFTPRKIPGTHFC